MTDKISDNYFFEMLVDGSEEIRIEHNYVQDVRCDENISDKIFIQLKDTEFSGKECAGITLKEAKIIISELEKFIKYYEDRMQ